MSELPPVAETVANRIDSGLSNVLFDVWLAFRAVHPLIDDAIRPSGLDVDEFAIYSVLAAGTAMSPRSWPTGWQPLPRRCRATSRASSGAAMSDASPIQRTAAPTRRIDLGGSRSSPRRRHSGSVPRHCGHVLWLWLSADSQAGFLTTHLVEDQRERLRSPQESHPEVETSWNTEGFDGSWCHSRPMSGAVRSQTATIALSTLFVARFRLSRRFPCAIL